MVDRATGVIMELDTSPWTAFGTVDKLASVQAMTLLSVALMVLLVAADAARERRDRGTLALGVTLSGFAVAVVGLCVQTVPDLKELWQVKQVPDSVFGLFWYHGNAAAFLNLCWPVTLWLCVTLLRREERSLLKQMMLAGLVVALAVQMVAVFANVSKMGHFLLLLEVIMLLGAGFLAWRRQEMHEQETVGRRAWLLALFGVCILGVGAWMAGAGTGWKRWGVFADRNFDDPARRHATEMALKIGWDGGWNGTGPGTFEWVAAHYAAVDPRLKGGRWRHAHNDYAQFFAEWGWVGMPLLALLPLLAGSRVLRALRQALSHASKENMSFQRQAGLICFGTAIAGLLIHAVVDFPLQIPAIRCLTAALVGLALAMCQPSLAEPVHRRTTSRLRGRRRR